MKRTTSGFRLVMCIAVIGLLVTTSGCFREIFSRAYSVSGKITDADGKGIGGVAIAFSGGFGTATTSNDGKWAKDDLKGKVTVTPTKEGWKFTPASRTVSKEVSDVDFVGGCYDYAGYVEGAEWRYKVSSAFIYEGELLTGEYYSLMEVTSVRREGEWTYYDVAKTSIDSDDEIINSSVEVVGRKGMTYYNIEMDDDGEIYYCDELFTAPFNAGDTIGDFEVIRQESVTTAAGTFTAWYCHVSYDEDEVEIYADLWFAPYVGIVKIEIREGDIVAQEMELLSYEGQ
ncbi:MAG: carboxypeptidase-like regulatory domain-containing protein [Firmicutes bacterium]|nr:carboxypeptidase-like regulatory domain-containing protein [Bacillota bacterium]